MDKSFDWDDLRTFLLIARHHTLSGAARALGVQQPTMGRRLEALETRAGARLLQKTPTGYVLTPAGKSVMAHVERIEAETLAIERAIAGTDVRLEGTVRLTTLETFAEIILPPILAQLHATYPGIVVEVLADARSLSLTKREADIALRFAQFTQADLTVRRVAETAYGLYASPSYLEARGQPDFSKGAPGHHVVADIDGPARPEMQWLHEQTSRAAPAFAANSRGAQQAMIAAGIGIGCVARYAGDPDGRLVLLPAAKPSPLREVWLGVHSDTRHTPKSAWSPMLWWPACGSLSPV